MAPIEQYLMDRTAEITLARSASPESISRDATILVLGRQGYETAVQGKNGFVCMVGRAWGAAFDWAEFWNPKVRAAGSVQSLLVLRAEGRIPNERAATDSCVLSRGHKLVRRNACRPA